MGVIIILLLNLKKISLFECWGPECLKQGMNLKEIFDGMNT